MRLRFIFFLLSITLLNARNTCNAQVVEIQGFVRAADGKPINNVIIHRLGKTDEAGHFKMAADVLRYCKTLIFDKKGFVPTVISLDPKNTNLNITLEQEKDISVWDIPTCSSARGNGKRLVGKYLILSLPREMKFKTGVDSDYRYYSMRLTQGGKTHFLNGGWGNLYGGTYPSGEVLLRMQHYTYRRTSLGIDWRGVTKDGKYCRYFGASPVFEIYFYETDSKEAANVFDRILEGICFNLDK